MTLAADCGVLSCTEKMNIKGRERVIAIIDYGAGNLSSVKKACEHIGCTARVTSDRKAVLSSARIILPGVGAFGDAMDGLIKSGMDDVVREAVQRSLPLLGICLGLQLLFETSEESPGVGGLGILEGSVLRIPQKEGLKIPHVGWNTLRAREGAGLFASLPPSPFVYFVHSYYAKAAEREKVIATAEHGVEMDVAVKDGNMQAVQFHPEKSGAVGLDILRNFAFGVRGEGGLG